MLYLIQILNLAIKMFGHMTIHLKGPICRCDTQSLRCVIIVDTIIKEFYLLIECKICNTQINVPLDNRLDVIFKLDIPYRKSFPLRISSPQKLLPLPKRDNKLTVNDRRFLRSLRISADYDEEDDNEGTD